MLDIKASDSSDFQEFVYSVQRPNEAFLRRMTVEETELSSGQRELGAILHSMEANANLLYSPEPAIIYWLTDSTNVCSWLEKGSRKPHIQEEVFKIVSLLSNLNINIVPIHVPKNTLF